MAGAAIVDLARHELLARARLTLDQHARAGGSHERELPQQLPDSDAFPQDATAREERRLDLLAQVDVLELDSLAQRVDLGEGPAVGEGHRRVVREGAQPREGRLVAALSVEHRQRAEDLSAEDQGLTAEAADALGPDPFRPHEEVRLPFHVPHEQGDAAGPDATHLAHAQREAAERAVHARPVLAALARVALARDEMQAARLVGAFRPHRAARTDVARADEPHARQGDSGLRRELVDHTSQQLLERTLLGHRERHGLERLRRHTTK